MKVSELEGAELDYWVARASGFNMNDDPVPQFSSEWAYGGPIIERENIGVERCGDGWYAAKWWRDEYGDWWRRPAEADGLGPTPLIAAMRCFVASKFGEEVPDKTLGQRLRDSGMAEVPESKKSVLGY